MQDYVCLREGDPPCRWQAQANGLRARMTREEMQQDNAKNLNRPPTYAILSQPPNNKQGSAHLTLSFRAGPIRMGRAKNLPVGGKDAGVCCQYEEDFSACGEILPAVGRRKRTPCGAQDDGAGDGSMCLSAQIRPSPPILRSAFCIQPFSSLFPASRIIRAWPRHTFHKKGALPWHLRRSKTGR